ncbi:MAG: flippase [Proteobacteria bacterium]|nr:flippase [Pseudomonadota bacterium]MBU1710329.1 flippase [Pseudomonadota bacterium]
MNSEDTPHTKSNTRNQETSFSILKSAGIGGIGSIIFGVVNFLNNVLLTRYLGAESYGVFVLSTTIISYLILICLLGMETSMLKLIAEYRATQDTPKLKGSLWAGMGTPFAFSIFVVLILYFSADFFCGSLLHKPEISPVYKLLLLSVPFSVLVRVLLGALQGAKAIKFRVIIERIATPLLRALIIVAVIIVDRGVTALATGYVIVAIAGSALSIYYLTLAIPEFFAKDKMIIESRKIKNLAATIYFTRICQQVLTKLDIVIIGYFLPAAMVGIYSAASRIPPLIAVPMVLVNLGFAPIISAMHARSEIEELNLQLKITTKWIITASLPLLFLLVYFAPDILRIFGKDFAAGATIMTIICFGFFADSATGSSGYMLMMTNHAKFNLLNSIITGILSVLLNLVLIPRFELIGAAVANTVSILVLQILRLIQLFYLLKIHPYSLDTLKPIFSLIMAVAIALLVNFIWSPENVLFSSIATTVLFLGCYVQGLRILKFSPEDEIILNRIKEKISGLVNKIFGSKKTLE